MQDTNGGRNQRGVERTIAWFSISLLFAIVGIHEIANHKRSGWVCVALPVVVLVVHFWRTQPGTDA